MNKPFSNFFSSATPSRGDCNRFQWFLASGTGLVIAIISSVLLLSVGLAAGPSVHAFSKQTREAGAATFREKGCEHCHGVNGIGTDRGPDLSTIGKRWKKDHIELQIRNGGGGMPPFGDALQPDEVRDLVDYLNAKRKPSKAMQPPTCVKSAQDESGL